jgi:hypothetical protein
VEDIVILRLSEVFPCEHRFPVDCIDGERFCFVCGEELPPEKEEAPDRVSGASAGPSSSLSAN